MNVNEWFAATTAACNEINRQVRTGEILSLSKEEGDKKVIEAVESSVNLPPDKIWNKKIK